MSLSLFIISGEASSDIHGAKLIKELKKTSPRLNIFAWGGDKMQAEGATLLKHYSDLAFMGFMEVVKNLPSIIKNFLLIKKQIKSIRPSVVILMDYPGFNLRLLPWLKKAGYTVIYYIAPQAWAWKEDRVKIMSKYIDKLLVILPFEELFFSSRGVDREFVGHPLLQELGKANAENKKSIIALLPGSRQQEIRHILPEMLSIVDEFPRYQFVIAGMEHIGREFYDKMIGDKKVSIVWNESQTLVNKSKLALVSSGTATLETALMETPMIVCYKTGRINYELAKRLIKVPYISLVNLIFGREVVKELIQKDLNKENLCAEMNKLLHVEYQSKMVEDFKSLKSILGSKNASERAARIIMDLIHIK